MRTYTFKRECGHTVRGKRKSYSLARPCLNCYSEQIAKAETPEQATELEHKFLNQEQRAKENWIDD